MVFFITLLPFIIVGFQMEDFYGFVVSVCAGVFIGFVLQLGFWDGLSQIESKDSLEKMRKEIKEQDEYVNYWGPMNHRDRDKEDKEEKEDKNRRRR